MRKQFDVPKFYSSEPVSGIKRLRQIKDPKKKDLTPTLLDFSNFRVLLARHFGFCFGVENAIEIAYRAIKENRDKTVYLLSEVIHNQDVNADLKAQGVEFLQDTLGNWLIRPEELSASDIVIVPAFGTSLEVQNILNSKGINPYQYDSTCPFVEKVWKRAKELGAKGFSVVIHGKRNHEETRATFSHSNSAANTVVVRDMQDTELLCKFIRGEKEPEDFALHFGDCCSENFNPSEDLKKLGVINQTTMLASETKEIALKIKEAVLFRHDETHFADTRDTLCYATYENQAATKELMNHKVDFSLVVGGFNSSNTSHLVELLGSKIPTFYIRGAGDILSLEEIVNFDVHSGEVITSNNWFIENSTIGITAGASCPDSLVHEVIVKLSQLANSTTSLESLYNEFK